MSTDQSAGIRRARAAETEAALKAAARRGFAERGYLTAKITDITAAAGRAAGSFYNHFSGKEDLLRALLTDMLAASDARVAADDEHDPDLGKRSAVRHHVRAYLDSFRANREVMVALHQAAMVDPAFRATLDDLTSPDLHHIAEHLDHVRRAGGALPGEPLAVAKAIGALLWGYGHAHVVEGTTGLTDDAAVDLLTDLIHRGVAGTPPA